MEVDFIGKVVIVTGASAGIGEATALLFAKCGAQVVVVGRNEGNVAAVAQRCEGERGQRALPVVADVGTDEGCEKVAKDTIDAYGR
jgi:NADP-dependent 3-hydroxy acid dehydrogenase YdfG